MATKKEQNRKGNQTRGRNGNLTKALQDKIIGYIENGASNKDACSLVGICEASFYEWISKGESREPTARDQKYIDFAEAIKAAQAKFKMWHVQNINRAAKDSWQASAWTLERRFKEEFGRLQVEHSGHVSHDIEVNIVPDKISGKSAKDMKVDADGE